MRVAIVCLFLVSTLVGCVADAGDTGRMSLSLVTTSTTSGTSYRLRHGDLTVAGGGRTVVFHSEDHLDEQVIQASLPVGAYTIALATGWSLERMETDGTAQTVEAWLTSASPLGFQVTSGGTTTVDLQLRTSGLVVEPPAHGDVAIKMTVDDAPLQPGPIGFPQYGGSTENKAPTRVYAQRVTVTQAVRLDRLGVIANSPFGIGVTLALYSDANGAPGQRLALTAQTPNGFIPQPTVAAIDPVVLEAGRPYWLAVAGALTVGRIPSTTVARCDANASLTPTPPVEASWNCQQGTAINLFAAGTP